MSRFLTPKAKVLYTSGGMRFQHQPMTVFLDGKPTGGEPTTEKIERNVRYYLGWVGPIGACFLQWVRADNLVTRLQ